MVRAATFFALTVCTCAAQDRDSQPPPASAEPTQAWNLFFQSTSIGQYHGTFPSPYAGQFSLQNHPESVVSLTATVYLGLRLTRNTGLYFNPELAGGRGFSGVNGLANSSNGELPRVASATPKPYLARLFVTHDFGWGDATEKVEGDENQLGGSRSVNRYTITLGRFTMTDYFDGNRYSHDPRTQFMGWGVMYNGAWDYPADVRGYTWGWVHELHLRNWSFLWGNGAMPKVANGLRFDRRLFVNRADMFEVEHRHGSGSVRLLSYINHARAGDYGEALRLSDPPVVTDTRQDGTRKYGFGVSADQEVAPGIGVFGRLGWNDGQTESFAFTAIDRLATIGTSVNGSRWRRKRDTAASEITFAGISPVHREYLANGGYDFLIGDGTLRYGRETIWESYYSAFVGAGFTVSLDAQRVWNPAYNRDRGPLWIASLRLHLEFGVK
jgi:high affinity Mn2+ porin